MLVKRLIGFAAISGVGWLGDLATFVLLLRALGAPPFLANLISSYVGLTFVYFTSIRFVFMKYDARRALFLLMYWMYQALSTVAYSVLIGWLASAIVHLQPILPNSDYMGVVAKIAVTPLSLCTNFIFMKILTIPMADLPMQEACVSRGRDFSHE